MLRTLPNALLLLQRAADGNARSLQILGLENGCEYSAPPCFDPDKMTREDMRQEVLDLLYFAEAAHRLHHDKAESAARRAISYLSYAYRCLFEQNIRLNGVLDGPDLAEELITLVKQTATSCDKLREVQAKEEHREFRASGGRLTDESESSYSPGDDSGSDSESDSPAKAKCRGKRPPETPKKTTQTTPSKNPPKGKAPVSGKRPEEDPVPASPKHAKMAPSPPRSPPSSKRSHHKLKPCPVQDCNFHGVDLRRHLLVHVKRNDISENAVDKLLAIVQVATQKRGKVLPRKGKQPISGRKKKWCPVPFCTSIVLNIGRHLTNPHTHGVIKGSREYQRLMMQAREYTGVSEMDVELLPLLALSLVSHPPSQLHLPLLALSLVSHPPSQLHLPLLALSLVPHPPSQLHLLRVHLQLLALPQAQTPSRKLAPR